MSLTLPIYLDNAAATPVDAAVFAAMQPFFGERFYNPSAQYLVAKEIARDIAAARAGVAKQLGVRPPEITFTAGGTEANNLAVQGVMEQFPGANLVVSAIEHDSVLVPADAYDCRVAPVQADGRVDVESLRRLIDDKTVLISVMYVNNEVGTVQPIESISQVIQAVRQERSASGNKLPLYLHTDACQAANYLPLLLHTLGVDMMTLNGGKMYGPKQSGVLAVRTGVVMRPQILGGGQERGLRSGTENVAGIIGLAVALEAAQAVRVTEADRLTELQHYAVKRLLEAVEGVIINGSVHRTLQKESTMDANRMAHVLLQHRIPNNVHFSVPGYDNERLMMELDERGIQCATGSACSASSDEPSHVLRALGIPDNEAQASLRITMGRDTTKQAIDYVVETLAQIIK
jgi:cysteine desulfurase